MTEELFHRYQRHEAGAMTYFETQTHRQTRTYTFRTYHQQESILGAKGKKKPKQLNE